MTLAHENELEQPAREDPLPALVRVIGDDGRPDPETDPRIDAGSARRMYREMKRLRLLDARMILLQRQGRVGFYGACTGQEAAPIATASAAQPEDWVFPALRESAIMLVRGFPLRPVHRAGLRQLGGHLKGRQMPLAHERAQRAPGVVVELHGDRRFRRRSAPRGRRSCGATAW